MLPTVSLMTSASLDVFFIFLNSVHDLFIPKALHNQMVQQPAAALQTVNHYVSLCTRHEVYRWICNACDKIVH